MRGAIDLILTIYRFVTLNGIVRVRGRVWTFCVDWRHVTKSAQGVRKLILGVVVVLGRCSQNDVCENEKRRK